MNYVNHFFFSDIQILELNISKMLEKGYEKKNL